MKIKRIIGGLSIAATGFVFLYAGIGKSENPSAFLFVLEEYQLNWPLGYIHLVASILPVLEIVLGILILGNLLLGPGVYRYITLGAGVVMLTVFLGVMIWALANGDIFGCGCFGGLGGQLSFWDVLRDGLFVGVALAGFADESHTT